jgi:fucose permease
MSISAVTILSTFIFGVVSDKFGLSMSLVISSIVCFVTVIIFKVVELFEKSSTAKTQKESG